MNENQYFKNKERKLNHLKTLEYLLKEAYRKHQFCKRIYESSNKKSKEENQEEKVILIDNGKNIFSEIPIDVIDYLINMGDFNPNIFDPTNGDIIINDYHDIIETIKFLIDVLIFDLTKAYIADI
jgi:hypothetical protein